MSLERHAIRPLAESGDAVTLRRADFVALIEELDVAAKQIMVLERQLAVEKGVGPRALAEDEQERLIAGESPVRVWREKRGLNQRALAVAAGMSQSHLAEIEMGLKTGSVETLRRLARVLNVQLDALVPVTGGGRRDVL